MKQNSSLFILLFCIATLPACDDKAVIASSTSRSPDQKWIVNLKTIQYGGPGTAGLQTEAYLERSEKSKNQINILIVTPNLSWKAGDSTEVSARWVNSNHLSMRYKKGSVVEFQASRVGEIEISSEEIE